MPKLWSSLVKTKSGNERHITSIDDYAHALNQFTYAGNTYGLGGNVTQSLSGSPAENITNSLEGYARAAYASNGVVFSCMLTRMLVFSATRFTYQRLSKGQPSKLFGAPELDLLEYPWRGGTTQDLLIRMIVDVDLAGNSYLTVHEGELVRLRPDWVSIVLEPRRFRGGTLGHRVLGYVYEEGGLNTGGDPIPLLPDEVAHFAPLPDPLASYRGMSWLTPVLREIRGDGQMMNHKQKFFENAATPNLTVSLNEQVTKEQFKEFMELMDESHKGADNAYKTMYLGGGADVEVVGADFNQMSFKTVQGHMETRIAAAAGVPPVIVGLSEGLQAATYSNYSQARRRFADGTMHPLWENAAGSLAPLVPRKPGARLWYNSRHVPFLREDSKDLAQIQSLEASTMGRLVQEGFVPDSVKEAVISQDWDLLEHTGNVSVQLHDPNAVEPNGDDDNGSGSNDGSGSDDDGDEE